LLYEGGAVANVVSVEGDGYDFGAGEDGFQQHRIYTVVSKGEPLLNQNTADKKIS